MEAGGSAVKRRTGIVVGALVMVWLVIPSHAFGQATRTWVSGVGDDANPCSRTAPCKTFAGAISKTATNGEINCLDSGGFGGVTITKSITIDCRSVHGGVLVSGTNAIVVNAPSTSNVALRGLAINGLGTSLNAIRVLAARSVRMRGLEIFGFTRNAVDIESSTFVRAYLTNSFVHDNGGNGVLVAPAAAGGASSRITIRRSEIDTNGCGATASSFLSDPAFNFASNCGVLQSGTARLAVITSFNSTFSDNTGAGIFASGGSGVQRIGGNEIFANGTGLLSTGGGAILSWGDNYVAGNTTDGNPTGPITRR
jgi:parallel beta helix pectate lyase-like protein